MKKLLNWLVALFRRPAYANYLVTASVYPEKDARDYAASVGGIAYPLNHAAHSMLGTGLGDWAVVTKMADYVVGDIVIFATKTGDLIIHRVTHVEPSRVYTKGDFCRTGDGWSDLRDVRGKVVRGFKHH